MGKVKSVSEYQEEIKQLHNKLYSLGAKNDVERTTMERLLHSKIKAWSLKVDVIIESPGNEQNPWTEDELGRPVRLMGLKKETGDRQFGDYRVLVCTHGSTGNKDPAIWRYLPVVVERKGGPQSKKYKLMFNWSDVALDDYSSLVEFLHKEHKCDWVNEEHVCVLNQGTTLRVGDGARTIQLDLDDKKKNVTMEINNIGSTFKYKVKKTPKTGVLKVYEIEYGPGKGGANDLYGTLYGAPTLKDGTKRPNRDRLKEEIERFREDTRFKQFWLIAECTRTQFMSFRPKFNGKKRSSGFGANANSRKALLVSIGLDFGGSICWGGTRQGAVDDLKEIINQGLVKYYAELLELE